MQIEAQIKRNTIVYVATRKPLLFAWAIASVVWTLVFIADVVANGHDSLATIALMIGGGAVCGLGVAVMAVGSVFMMLRASTKPTLELQPDEVLLDERHGSHVLGRENRAGRLLVTNRRLGFQPSRFSVQLETWSVALDEIESVEVIVERHDHGIARGLLAIGTKNERSLLGMLRPRELAEYVGKLQSRDEHERGPIDVEIPEARLVAR
jgi:hypothetical protein